MCDAPRALWIGRFLLAALAPLGGGLAPAGEPRFRAAEIDRSLTVGYAVQLVDLNADQRPDIVVVDSDRVVWFENPSWKLHTLISGGTKRDNVCIAPHDIDGDGQVDFALGADWRPADTKTSGSIQWLRRGAKPDDPWQVHPIGVEPTVHRMRWVDLQRDGRPELVVVPLQGRGTTAPHFSEQGVRILAYPIPQDPVAGPWEPVVLNDLLHVTHNFWPTEFGLKGSTSLLVASFEGVTLLSPPALPQDPLGGSWAAQRIGAGNQETSPNRGASEIKQGSLAGRRTYLATIEPWHGFQVVVYTPPPAASSPQLPNLWQRHVIDDELAWGHAVWCANLDDDPAEELIVGVRDNKSDTARSGLRIYDPQDPLGQEWKRQLVDPGGVAIEDAVAGDLNGDGRADIVAVGRATHNVRIYWNEK
ncbi:MAG: VCBS repeat-containing protein [Planctomycetaceae bacterium]|nr:VCBS repeat-containing protein [Planctomycetaceae bacterium]